MGGTVIETESEKLIRRGREAGKAEEIIEMGQEFGLDDAAILKRLQERKGKDRSVFRNSRRLFGAIWETEIFQLKAKESD